VSRGAIHDGRRGTRLRSPLRQKEGGQDHGRSGRREHEAEAPSRQCFAGFGHRVADAGDEGGRRIDAKQPGHLGVRDRERLAQRRELGAARCASTPAEAAAPAARSLSTSR
jgi:hypothetical protein